MVPRIIQGHEWDGVERGLKQRLKALNLFINDIYNEQQIINDGIIPSDILLSSRDFRPECKGVRLKFGVWAHICGSDLIRDHEGLFRARGQFEGAIGVSYMLENRNVSKRIVPELPTDCRYGPWITIPLNCRHVVLIVTQSNGSLRSLLTPGIYNSAYFEHAFLAQRMGVELVEGRTVR